LRYFRYKSARPGRRTGQRWERTRAPTQGPGTKRGVVHDTPFGSPQKNQRTSGLAQSDKSSRKYSPSLFLAPITPVTRVPLLTYRADLTHRFPRGPNKYDEQTTIWSHLFDFTNSCSFKRNRAFRDLFNQKLPAPYRIAKTIVPPTPGPFERAHMFPGVHVRTSLVHACSPACMSARGSCTRVLWRACEHNPRARMFP